MQELLATLRSFYSVNDAFHTCSEWTPYEGTPMRAVGLNYENAVANMPYSLTILPSDGFELRNLWEGELLSGTVTRGEGFQVAFVVHAITRRTKEGRGTRHELTSPGIALPGMWREAPLAWLRPKPVFQP